MTISMALYEFGTLVWLCGACVGFFIGFFAAHAMLGKP